MDAVYNWFMYPSIPDYERTNHIWDMIHCYYPSISITQLSRYILRITHKDSKVSIMIDTSTSWKEIQKNINAIIIK